MPAPADNTPPGQAKKTPDTETPTQEQDRRPPFTRPNRDRHQHQPKQPGRGKTPEPQPTPDPT